MNRKCFKIDLRYVGLIPHMSLVKVRRSFSARIGDGRHQGILHLAGIQWRMLDHHRDVALEDAGVGHSKWNRLWVSEIVETEMLGAPRRDRHPIGTRRLPVRIVEGHHYVCFMVRVLRTQNASWLVSSGSGPLLQAGIYPSAMAQVFRPIFFDIKIIF
jgi:hypothetical protein